MDHFTYQKGTAPSQTAYCEQVPLERIAKEVGTPAYVYSKATLDRHCQAILDAFSSLPTLPCFAVKANSNLSVLNTIFAHGLGADVVSGGELSRARLAGAPANKIVFSGVGKSPAEIKLGLSESILSFNAESVGELEVIAGVAASMNKVAPVSLRINPNVYAKTNPKIATGMYTTKFGIAESDLPEVLEIIKSHKQLRLVGIGCHIGSQILDLTPFEQAAQSLASKAMELKAAGFELQFIDLGGGLGIRYLDENPPPVEEYAATLIKHIAPTGLQLIIEPGRSLAGNAGVLLTSVMGLKSTPKKNFIVVDGAMNDLMRPSLYGAYHDILPVVKNTNAAKTFDIVGPICETGDFLGQARELQQVAVDDLLFVRSCGAYGASMASNYNTRPRAVEVLVDGSTYKVVKPRETMESLWGEELKLLK